MSLNSRAANFGFEAACGIIGSIQKIEPEQIGQEQRDAGYRNNVRSV
jgi:hypothetical protein